MKKRQSRTTCSRHNIFNLRQAWRCSCGKTC